MENILLLCDDQWMYENIQGIVGKKYNLKWCPYELLREYKYRNVDAVIMFFDHKMVHLGLFEPIIQVKGKYGHSIPILGIIESGTEQDIFSVLNMGVYDYIDLSSGFADYQDKIDDLLRWNWYLKKYKKC